MVNSVYELGKPEPTYTGDAVVETLTNPAPTTVVLAWAERDKLVKGAFALGATYKDGGHRDAPVFADVKVMPLSGDVQYAQVTLAADGTVTFDAWFNADGTTGSAPSLDGARIAYRYDNVVVPQGTLPTLKAVVENLPLMARARRIAVFYSQIAAFQA